MLAARRAAEGYRMLQFVAGFLTCAAIVFAGYFCIEYKQYAKAEADFVDRKFKVAHPVQHKAKSALRKISLR